MLILGLDPGSRFCGFGLVDASLGAERLKFVEAGVIRLSDDWPLARRLSVLAEKLDELFVRQRIGAVSLEKIFFGRNADSAFKLGHARGVCMMIAGRHQIVVNEYAARKVKKSVSGSGGASKEHIQLVIQSRLGIKNQMAFDASDALALAITHALESEVEERIRRAMEASP